MSMWKTLLPYFGPIVKVLAFILLIFGIILALHVANHLGVEVPWLSELAQIIVKMLTFESIGL